MVFITKIWYYYVRGKVGYVDYCPKHEGCNVTLLPKALEHSNSIIFYVCHFSDILASSLVLGVTCWSASSSHLRPPQAKHDSTGKHNIGIGINESNDSTINY